MKKATWIKVFACLVAAIPPIIVLCVKFPVIISRTDKTISMAGIFVLIILVLIFKDAFKRFFNTPGYLKFSVVILIMSLFLVSLADEMIAISLTAAMSGLCALPLNIWYDSLTKPMTSKQANEIIKKEMKKDESDKTNIN